jgi:arginine:ornithine antiporter / lysine permease
LSTASATDASAPATPQEKKKLTLLPLAGLVVGSMVGAGMFNLPGDMSANASPGAIAIGWAITGVGMLMLALVYQGLAIRKPDLNSGPYAYARAGFGPYIGFQSAWGYWLCAWIGNVSNVIVIFASLGFFFQIFGTGSNLASVIGASVVLWSLHFLVLRGVKRAAFVNVVTAITQFVPVIAFLLIAIVAFNYDKFTLDFWGTGSGTETSLGSITDQVKSTMIVTLWVFLGIEGASVYSAYAAKRADVGTATIIGFASTLIIYVLVSMLSTGILRQSELAELTPPSMAGVLQSVVGPWGAAFVSAALIITASGNFLSWILLSAEIPHAAAKDGTFPRWFAVENDAGSPSNSLWISNLMIQLFLVVALFAESGYKLLYSVASVSILPAYVFSGAYALKLAITGETFAGDPSRRRRALIVGGLATLYGLWLCYAADLGQLLLATVLFAPGTIIYIIARRERGERLLAPQEAMIALALLAAALFATYLRISTGVPLADYL